jgi:valyl-tRNA synthetase
LKGGSGLTATIFLDKFYLPQESEKKWYKKWEENGFFAPHLGNGKFSMVIPPPNITNVLHVGHALNIVLQDVVTRYQRMKGKETLWVPGEDHAGIATQNIIVKKLALDGKTKEEIGYDEFLETTWEWAKEYKDKIKNQVKSMGASCDWSRERFTLDEGLSKAVRKVFVSLYKKGLIYKGKYMINWCPSCGTVLSNEEIEYENEHSEIYYINYPLESGENVVIATTRPETMLGDTAIAVNPKDERYKDIIGKNAILPLVGRVIPVISDDYVDMTFGTGALKVTPAHDPNDFEIGKKHKLEAIEILDDEAKISFDGPYKGLSREKARKAIVSDLRNGGYLVKVEKYDHSVGHCYRCHTSVEPKISDQWFVSMKSLAEPAIRAVKEGKVKFHPERWEKVYLNWMEDVHDWCISRQLWWGHRIPVWYCDDCGHLTVSETDPEKCEFCGSTHIHQDNDVLDTWFSSALWPFSTLGWPEETEDLRKFYPTDLLVTGFDIIFFWVARMIVMGLEFMDEVPFHDVYIHQLVRDKFGKKMSKSLGNGIDPNEVIQKYGADAMRMTLAMLAAQGRDINLDERAFESYMHFANKIWNASHFVEINTQNVKIEHFQGLTMADRWILSRLNMVIKDVTTALESYDYNIAAHGIYDFFWGDFCDWYIELSKVQLEDPKLRENTQQVLLHVLQQSLKLLHPFMPFISEEIWSNFFDEFLINASWPIEKPEFYFEDDGFDFLMETIRGIRNVRSDLDLPPASKINVVMVGKSNWPKDSPFELYISRLVNAYSVETARIKPKKGMTAAMNSDMEIFVVMDEHFDFNGEIVRLNSKIVKAAEEFRKLDSRLSNDEFLKKASADVVEKAKNEKFEIEKTLKRLDNTLRKLKE